MAELYVKITSIKNGVVKAGIHRGSTAEKSVPLGDYNQEIQALLRGKDKDTKIKCIEVDNPTPENIRPIANAEMELPKMNQGTTSSDKNYFDTNPYNFTSFSKKFSRIKEKEYSERSKHDKWQEGRFSGKMTISLKAKTPIFIPEGITENNKEKIQTPLKFWSCRKNNNTLKGIPGSSVKGVVSTLFETWTNSPLRIVDMKNITSALPYRRRIASMFIITDDWDGGGLKFADTEVKWGKYNDSSKTFSIINPIDKNYNGKLESKDILLPLNGDAVDVSNTTKWQIINFRANLFWVPTTDHKHSKYTHLAVKVGTNNFTCSSDKVKKYLKMLGVDSVASPAFTNHPECIKATLESGLGTNYYKKVFSAGGKTIVKESFEQRKQDLQRLKKGDIVFGGVNKSSTKIECFGKNLNFLWPGEKSPLELLGSFYRDEALLSCDDASVADLAFGFAGKHTDTSHPFKGRLQFSTFWKTSSHEDMPPLELGPLTSPSGLKLKARPLYLRPGTNGLSRTYDEATEMRGRKHYWHQREDNGSKLHKDHLADNPAYENQKSQCPPKIIPLPKGTEFEGEIQFTNLTEIELGALLVSIDPNLYFNKNQQNRAYGWKIGKGKPRGMGSVTAEIEKLLLFDITSCWTDLSKEPLIEAGLKKTEESEQLDKHWFVNHFRNVLDKSFPEYVDELRKLLCIPTGNIFLNYHPTLGDYGWLPKFGDPKGEPNGGKPRPVAMPLASKKTVP